MTRIYNHIGLAKASLEDLDDFIKENDMNYCLLTIGNVMLLLEIDNQNPEIEPLYQSLIEKTKKILPLKDEWYGKFVSWLNKSEFLLADKKTTPSDNYRIVESLIKKAPLN